MQQPQPDDEYMIDISLVKRETKEGYGQIAILVRAKDFDMTPAGFAVRYLYPAAANVLNLFHERHSTG